MKEAQTQQKNIFLYVPNLIGYTRFLLLLAASFFAFSMPYVFVGLHFTSFFLDYFDGIAARSLNQCSSFGHHLDTITDIVGFCLIFIATAMNSD
jgi:CDP-diacylglycerol--inositol 3-phosphatidyltransferase